MPKKLPRKFYTQPTKEVAKKLLGKHLVHQFKNKKLVGKIIETEAYMGPKDKASHVRNNKKTKRNKIIWQAGGYIYIYLVYGMYWQLNITTEKLNVLECVLIRALEPILDKNHQSQIANHKQIKNLTSGPGKLCQWMKLDKSFYGEDLTKSKRIWLEKGEEIKPSQIISAKRIGIDYAQEWAKKPLRFYVGG